MPTKSARRACHATLILATLLAFTGCWKKSGEAIVIGKDYVPANASYSQPNESPTPGPSLTPEEEAARDTALTEAYESFIGPPLDPRANGEEQWIATVRLVGDGRLVEVRLDKARWDKLQPDDRVQVHYREGKYTGTIWSSDID